MSSKREYFVQLSGQQTSIQVGFRSLIFVCEPRARRLTKLNALCSEQIWPGFLVYHSAGFSGIASLSTDEEAGQATVNASLLRRKSCYHRV